MYSQGIYSLSIWRGGPFIRLASLALKILLGSEFVDIKVTEFQMDPLPKVWTV